MKICFTGHRPEKLGGYNWNTSKNLAIIREIRIALLKLIEEENPNKIEFICGGALGTDQMSFEVCYRLKEFYKGKIKITIEVAVPYKNQPKKWFNKVDINRYYSQLERADKVTEVDSVAGYIRTKTPIGEHNNYKLQIRNEYMVDSSDIVVAIYDGSRGGTANCIEYAEKKDKRIIVINPNCMN